MGDPMRLADVLAALSMMTDLAMGHEPEKAIRSTVLATEIARSLDIPEPGVADVYYATLLKHLGCTATTHEEAFLFGPDEIAFRSLAERTDESSAREAMALIAGAGRGAGGKRLTYLARAVGSAKASQRIFTAICEVGARMASRLGLGEGVEGALAAMLARWDGKGAPKDLAGGDVPLPVRIAEPATQAVIFHRLGGFEAVVEMARRRAGGMFDPAVVAKLEEVGPAVFDRLEASDPWIAVLEEEPTPVRDVAPEHLDRVAEAFADMADLKSTYTLGHSSGVADLASGAAERLGVDDPGSVRRAALLHDLGRVAVPTGIWEKAGPLTTSEWERVQLHAYHTERILSRSEALTPLAKLAGMHHERQDGSGYHRSSAAAELPVQARLLAVADAYQAMTQDRPHRPALGAPEAAAAVEGELRDGRFDPECARAVLEAAGQTPSRKKGTWPAGLTDREVQVLRLVCRGSSNAAIADDLTISRRTAEHHVQHIYTKIGASTRAAAAMFAMEHGLIGGVLTP